MNTVANQSRLRIAHVLPSLGVGGAENMAAHLMAGLSAEHDVTAIGLYPKRNSPVEARLGAANVRLRHLGKRPGIDARMFFALASAFREIRPHVVHTHLSVLRYVLPVLWRRPVPLAIHTLHNTADREADALGRFIQRVAFRKTVVPVAISLHGAASFRDVYGRECAALVPNCIPVEEFERTPDTGPRWRAQLGLPQDAIVFTCVGRLDEQKNPLSLLDAFAALCDERIRLVLLGDGGLRRRVLEAVRAAGLEQRVHVLGKRGDVADCLAASDVFVLASRWEGNPLSVMEAMAAGLPVVSTAVGGIPELVRHGHDGLLVRPGDAAELTAALRALANSPAQRRAFGAAAREHARAEFGVASMTRKYAQLYAGLVAANSGSKQPVMWTSQQGGDARPAAGERS